ncbi:DUF2232 domain-containing protein [Trichothermofontia sp.]
MPSSPESRDTPLASPSDCLPHEEISSQDAQPGVPSPVPTPPPFVEPHLTIPAPLSLVETAFLASTASLIWLVNYYFPIGPLLRIFFPLPITLVYLRWGHRATWMATLVSGLLLSVLMGPTRSILFIVPFGLLGVLLGWLWRNAVNWWIAIALGTLLNTVGFFFRIWLLSILLGDDLWAYSMVQIANLAEWIFTKLGVLAQPDLWVIQVIAVAVVLLNSVVYLFVVHLAAWLLLERLGSSIPAPPEWVQVLLDVDGSE